MTDAAKLAIIDRELLDLKARTEALLGRPVKVELSIHANGENNNFDLAEAAHLQGWTPGGMTDCCWLQSDMGLIGRGCRVTVFYNGIERQHGGS